MKKVYVKPQVLIESFKMNTNIAAGCEVKTDLPSAGECGLDFGGGDQIFLTNVAGCTDGYEVDDGAYNGICYHNPSETSNLFAS